MILVLMAQFLPATHGLTFTEIYFVSDIAVFVLKRDVKLQLTNYWNISHLPSLPTCTALTHFGSCLFLVLLRVGGWVGLVAWLHIPQMVSHISSNCSIQSNAVVTCQTAKSSSGSRRRRHSK